MPGQLRIWQRDAFEHYNKQNLQDYLMEATPAAGKTRAASAIAQDLLERQIVRQVVVVVPTDALRLQWADAQGLNLRPYDGDEVIVKSGYDGVVVTYQQLGGVTANLVRHAVSQHPTLAIMDEIHHAGERKAWCTGLITAFENATRRLVLTGTPWRRDNSPMPFVRYENDLALPDFAYRYADAVKDGICRPLIAEAYDGEVRWTDCGKVTETRVDGELDEDETGVALRGLYDPAHAWVPELFVKANDTLTELRVEIPDLGGLIVAEDRRHAQQYAEIMARVSGEPAVVVISDEAGNQEARSALARFRSGSQRWLVAVRMVSEGIDIPRLSVGVYASTTRTPLFFRQIVGRFVRVRPGEAHNAVLFIPAVPALMRHAYEIEEELRHEIEAEIIACRPGKIPDGDGLGGQLTFRIPLSASEPIFDRSIHRGIGYEATDVAEGRTLCQQYGIPETYALNIARLQRDRRPAAVDVTAVATVVPPVEATHQVEKRLRQEIEKLARRNDHHQSWDPGATNLELLKLGYPARKHCSMDELVSIREQLLNWLGP